MKTKQNKKTTITCSLVVMKKRRWTKSGTVYPGVFTCGEGSGEAFAINKISSSSVWTKVDKNGHFPNLVGTTGHTRGCFVDKIGHYHTVDALFKAHLFVKKGTKDEGVQSKKMFSLADPDVLLKA